MAAEPVPDFEHQADVALFRAVRSIPLSRFKDIICAHYGAKRFDAEWQRPQGIRQDWTRGNNNLRVYLAITNRFGKRPEAIKDIKRVYSDVTRTECESKVCVGTLSLRTQQSPLVEQCDPAAIDKAVVDKAAIEAAESITDPEIVIVEYENKGRVESFDSTTQQSPLVEQRDRTEICTVVENARSMSDYLEAFNCNVTRSCCHEFVEYGIGYYSDEDGKEEKWCSDQGDRFTECAPVCGGTMQHGDKPACQYVSEEESVKTPRVVLYEDC